MSEQDPRTEVDEAIRRVGHPVARIRLSGLRRLVRLADAHPHLRRPVVTVLGAYLRDSSARPHPVSGPELRNRRAVLDALRDHLADPDEPTSWCGLDVDLRDTVLDGDLSGIVVTGGAVRLDRARVPADGVLDLSGATVRGGVLSVDRVVVAGRLDATGMVVDGGEASLDRLVLDGGDVLLDGARLERGSLWLRDGEVDAGTLSVRGAQVNGGRLSLSDTQVRGGEIRLDDTSIDGGQLTVSGTTVDAGALRLDDVTVRSGVLSLAMSAVRGGLLSLAGASVTPPADDVRRGAKHGTAAAQVRFDGLTVEDDGVVLWGPFAPVEPAPAAEPTGARGIDLRGPAPPDPWAWLRRREARSARKVPTSDAPARHDVPSPGELEAS